MNWSCNSLLKIIASQLLLIVAIERLCETELLNFSRIRTVLGFCKFSERERDYEGPNTGIVRGIEAGVQ